MPKMSDPSVLSTGGAARENAWQPITSAPAMTMMLTVAHGFLPDTWIYRVTRRDPYGSWGRLGDEPWRPTYWQPLPPPPAPRAPTGRRMTDQRKFWAIVAILGAARDTYTPHGEVAERILAQLALLDRQVDTYGR